MEEAEFIKGEFLEVVQSYIETAKESGEDVSLLSDGYHSFNELYKFRLLYNAALFNEWAKNYSPEHSGLHKSDFPNYNKIGKHYNVHKSWRHHDGELCFGGGWFIVSAKLPDGLISNHYEEKYWDLFKIPELEKAMFEYDGHTAEDVMERISLLILKQN